jgi:hypothetical protein
VYEQRNKIHGEIGILFARGGDCEELSILVWKLEITSVDRNTGSEEILYLRKTT